MGHARERRLRPSVGQVGGGVGGRDGVTIPVLGLGVFQSPAEETAAAVETALRTGYRHIDTAAACFDEREVGEGLRRSGVDRAEVFIETKIQVTDYGYDETLHAFEKSTGKLDTDVPTDDVAGTVKELIAERKPGSRRSPDGGARPDSAARNWPPSPASASTTTRAWTVPGFASRNVIAQDRARAMSSATSSSPPGERRISRMRSQVPSRSWPRVAVRVSRRASRRASMGSLRVSTKPSV